ncbi:unnamed protein product, partial [Sphacelaria rigidula]
LILDVVVSGLLRTASTIKRFWQISARIGSQTPPSIYFSVLLQHGRLNATESIELTRSVLFYGRTNMLETWLTEARL